MKGTKFNRLLFQLQPKTHRIAETDAGLLLKTPCSADAYTEGMSKKEQKFGNSGTLAQEVQTGFIYQRGLLPTPSAMEDRSTPEAWDARYERKKSEGINLQMGLCTMARKGFLPTPSVSDTEGSPKRRNQITQGANGNWRRTSDNTGIIFGAKLNDVAPILANSTGKTSQLNPRFVAEMMGFPPNWTESPFQNGE
jgi:hypothetical protein